MTHAALRATRALQKENGRRLLTGEEFMSQEEIAELIDKEGGVSDLLEALKEIRDCVSLPSGTSLKSQRSFRDIAHDAITESERR